MTCTNLSNPIKPLKDLVFTASQNSSNTTTSGTTSSYQKVSDGTVTIDGLAVIDDSTQPPTQTLYDQSGNVLTGYHVVIGDVGSGFDWEFAKISNDGGDTVLDGSVQINKVTGEEKIFFNSAEVMGYSRVASVQQEATVSTQKAVVDANDVPLTQITVINLEDQTTQVIYQSSDGQVFTPALPVTESASNQTPQFSRLSDYSNTDFYYFGQDVPNGSDSWRIIRQDTATNTANEVNIPNATYADLDSAWVDRVTLAYQVV